MCQRRITLDTPKLCLRSEDLLEKYQEKNKRHCFKETSHCRSSGITRIAVWIAKKSKPLQKREVEIRTELIQSEAEPEIPGSRAVRCWALQHTHAWQAAAGCRVHSAPCLRDKSSAKKCTKNAHQFTHLLPSQGWFTPHQHQLFYYNGGTLLAWD